jgi:uncharacterized protein
VNAYAQLLSVGLVWISFHCAGMCGPLVIGFDVAGAARGRTVVAGALGIFVYQLGRLSTLILLGAIAGLAGRGLTKTIEPAGAVMALVFGVLVLASLVAKLLPKKPKPLRVRTRLEARAAPSEPETPLLQRLLSRLSPLQLSETLGGTWLLGALMGLLPCMIVFWALGLAATTASVFDGALVMALLVAMTTPMLLGVTLLPRLVPKRGLTVLPNVLMALSATWLVMVGLAGLGLAPHAHVALGDFTLMLW